MKFKINYYKKIIKKYKTLYRILKIIRHFIIYLSNRLAFFVSVVFHKLINKYFLIYSEKFISVDNYPKSLIDYILCYSILQKYQKLDLNELKKINYEKWAGESGTKWHNKNINKDKLFIKI